MCASLRDVKSVLSLSFLKVKFSGFVVFAVLLRVLRLPGGLYLKEVELLLVADSIFDFLSYGFIIAG